MRQFYYRAIDRTYIYLIGVNLRYYLFGSRVVADFEGSPLLLFTY